MDDYGVVIAGKTLEYLDKSHVYLVDGVIVPSITQLLHRRFDRYSSVQPDILKRAAEAGTAVHDAIEHYCKTGEKLPFPEVRNFAFLQKRHGFEVVSNEVPVILSDGEPIAAGRLDLVLRMDGKIGGADIKRTAKLDKEYVAYQLNLYRIAYRQSYGVDWEFLKAVHLKNNVRKLVDIPIDEKAAWEFLKEWAV